MIDFRLYLITDRRACGERPLVDVIDDACRAGVRAVQLREKDIEARPLFDLALRLKQITNRHQAKLLVNDRVDVAHAAGADGVHCPETGFPPDAALGILERDKLVGVSTHSLERIQQAEEKGADFVTFGPVFPTPSKLGYGPPQGLDTLKHVCANTALPVFAVGGITPEIAAACIENGAAGVALISAIIGADDVEGAVARFRVALGTL
jgi:thiamine-phosphate pyrophosphorylase